MIAIKHIGYFNGNHKSKLISTVKFYSIFIILRLINVVLPPYFQQWVRVNLDILWKIYLLNKSLIHWKTLPVMHASYFLFLR